MLNLRSFLAGCVALVAAANAFSHHSFSAEFDVGRPVTLAGTVKDFEWTNPHAWLHLETKDAQGNVELWAIEMLGVNSLIRNGMSPQTVKTGDLLTVTGFGSRDGTNTANASTVQRTETGQTLWTSDRGDGG
jgi:hypothetical protein